MYLIMQLRTISNTHLESCAVILDYDDYGDDQVNYDDDQVNYDDDQANCGHDRESWRGDVRACCPRYQTKL